MPVYAYRGLTSAGRSVQGVVDADSARGARIRLRRDGIFPTEVAEEHVQEKAKGGGLSLRRGLRMAPSELALVSRQLSTLIGAGVPVVEALAAVGEQSERPVVTQVLSHVRDRVTQGTPLADALAAADVASHLHWYDETIDTFKPTLFERIDAGITTTRGGIAETGSLIVWPDANEPRTLSLVPPLHIAVLHADALHETLHAAMRAQHWAARLPTNALLVTGPSKTADIQRLLVYGAHGPRQLVILLVHAEAR
ncbi:MAG TPA: LUD domain-containing protein [Tahibacter sp.]|nr:LUD domain-containing protein [Tahibacter sp.]